MTYNELLQETAEKKRKVIAEINEALEGPCDFLVKSEIEKNPGSVAWHYLAREFCEKLAEHVDEFIEQVGGVNSIEGHEIGDIYMAYEDGNEDIYELLPVEAQLFAAEQSPSSQSVNNKKRQPCNFSGLALLFFLIIYPFSDFRNSFDGICQTVFPFRFSNTTTQTKGFASHP